MKQRFSQLAEVHPVTSILVTEADYIRILADFIGAEEVHELFDELTRQQSVRNLKEEITALTQQTSVETLWQSPQKEQLEDLVGPEHCAAFFEDLERDQIRDYRQKLRSQVYYRGMSEVESSTEILGLRNLIDNEAFETFLRDLEDEHRQWVKRSRPRTYRCKELANYYNFARMTSTYEAQERFQYRIIGLLGSDGAAVFLSMIDQGSTLQDCLTQANTKANCQSYRKIVRRCAKFSGVAVARAEYLALGVDILGAEEAEDLFATLQEEENYPLTENTRNNMRKHLHFLTDTLEPVLTSQETQGLSLDEVTNAMEAQWRCNIERFEGQFFDEAASLIGHHSATISVAALDEIEAQQKHKEELRDQQLAGALEEIHVVLENAEEEWGENDADSARELCANQLIGMIDVNAPFSAQVRECFLISVRDFAKRHGVDEAHSLYREVVHLLWKTDFDRTADDFWEELDELANVEQGVEVTGSDAQTTSSVLPAVEEAHVEPVISTEDGDSGSAHEEPSGGDSIAPPSDVEQREASSSAIVTFGSSVECPRASFTFRFPAPQTIAQCCGSYSSSSSSRSEESSFAFSTPDFWTPSGSPASPVSQDSDPIPPEDLEENDPFDMKSLLSAIDDIARVECSPYNTTSLRLALEEIALEDCDSYMEGCGS